MGPEPEKLKTFVLFGTASLTILIVAFSGGATLFSTVHFANSFGPSSPTAARTVAPLRITFLDLPGTFFSHS
jgi:hypothetical protein